MDADDFPYRAEYAKSGRSSCKHCSSKIEQGSLRLAVLVQSPSFDGKITRWYHYKCFFVKQRPKSVMEIGHFDSLRWEDQQKVKDKVESGGAATPAAGSKKAKPKKVNNEFSVEYAKSGKAACKGCQEKIANKEVRISKLDYESEVAKMYGPKPNWHHVDCFIGLRNELEYFDGAENLPGFNTLSADDKKMLRGKIKKIEGKRKAEDEPDKPSKKVKKEEDNNMKEQSEKLFKIRDKLQKTLKKSELSELLEHNGYCDLSGESKMLDVLSDLMTFGVPEKCRVCKDGKFVYKFGVGYTCRGSISEWTRCTNTLDAPKRKPFVVPGDFHEIPFLKSYKFKDNGNRIVMKLASTNGGDTNGKHVEAGPLDGLTFVIVGSKFSKTKKEIKDKVTSMGGMVASKIEETTAAVITTADTLGGTSKQISTAKKLAIECVTEDFLDEITPDGIVLMIKKKNIASWETNVEERVGELLKRKELLKSNYKSKSKSSAVSSKYDSNMPETIKVTLKDGNHIDPKTKLAKTCHVYKKSGHTYSVVLGLVDIARGTNSYYKLQVLEADNKNSWHIYRRWGRIGTTIGDFRVEEKEDLQDALEAFDEIYEQKTGDFFINGSHEKLPGRWYRMDMEEGEKKMSKVKKPKVEGSKSKLPLPVKELIAMLFDVQKMESTMVEYELDLKKMPLGKLSKNQMEKAYKVLSEALKWIEKIKNEDTKSSEEQAISRNQILDCSNRFYTLIPHDFGINNPPLLNNEELIKSKIEMIDSLREIEIAFNLLKSEDGSAVDEIDKCYKKLKTDISVLEKNSDEYKMINKYISNTHAPTHSHYTLKLEEVYKVSREGEDKRFKPFKKLPNHKLLWHGSRLTNFAGILSQGLRIAPPEAPSTGYMFGKGVYFADMVSKSANYCFTSQTNPTGLLMLCDVALGNMHELKSANFITKLPSGKHSTKGLGHTCPDPAETITIDNGVEVPLGKPVDTSLKQSSLLYNEYIVYDVAQINIKYLLKTKFKFKY